MQVRDRPTTDEAEDGNVVEQRPGARTQVRPGSTVTIFVGRFEAPPEEEAPTTTTP